MRYLAIALAGAVLAGVFAAQAAPAFAGREDRVREARESRDWSERAERRRAAKERKWRHASSAKKRAAHRSYDRTSPYRYAYPWGPWGPFAAPPGL